MYSGKTEFRRILKIRRRIIWRESRFEEQQERDFEYVHQKTGERRWFHNIAMGSEVNGKKKYILVMSDRTSDRKMNQALSEAARAAETANRAKSTFLSNMSHDIRTPMNAIIGFTTLAVSNIDNKKRVRDYLGKILSSSNHLLSLINDILDMSRIESGKIDPDKGCQCQDADINIYFHRNTFLMTCCTGSGNFLPNSLRFDLSVRPYSNPSALYRNPLFCSK